MPCTALAPTDPPCRMTRQSRCCYTRPIRATGIRRSSAPSSTCSVTSSTIPSARCPGMGPGVSDSNRPDERSLRTPRLTGRSVLQVMPHPLAVELRDHPGTVRLLARPESGLASAAVRVREPNVRPLAGDCGLPEGRDKAGGQHEPAGPRASAVHHLSDLAVHAGGHAR